MSIGRPALALVAGLLAAGSAVARDGGPRPWQLVIRDDDRDRLREWRGVWKQALRQARDAGFAAGIAAEGALLDPDGAIPEPGLADGRYRCRAIKLGRQAASGTAFAAGSLVPCRVSAGRFDMLGGVQRPRGLVWRYDGSRLLFLGATSLSDETAAIPYGRDRERDSIGLVERVEARRWRLVLPRPRWESLVTVIEIVPG